MTVDILLSDNIELTSDRFQWNLNALGKPKLDKNGKEVIPRSIIGHYPTLQGVVDGYIEHIGRTSDAMTLEELRDIVQAAKDEILRQLVPEDGCDHGIPPPLGRIVVTPSES